MIAFLVAGGGIAVLIVRVGPEKLQERVLSLIPGARARVVIPEGYNRFQIAERLEQAEICTKEAFLLASTDRVLLDSLGISADSVEGYLFPATYDFFREIEASRVIERMVGEAKRRLRGFDRTRASAQVAALSEHEWLTLASIVEEETAIDEERARVAQVFLNRLASREGESRGRLQSDPTAAYGCLRAPEIPSCVGFTGKVTPALLRDSGNPYNTYRHAGLPPGPISNPGERSLRAVLEPSGGAELYFVADGQGRHTFSLTYEEHLSAVEALKARQK